VVVVLVVVSSVEVASCLAGWLTHER